MEVWLTMPGQKQKTKYRQQLPGILLEAGLILGICGAGISLLLEMLTGAADRLPFLSSVFFTALVCLFTETMKKGRQITGTLIFLITGIIIFSFAGFYWQELLYSGIKGQTCLGAVPGSILYGIRLSQM